jgi:hypothetical protein
MIRISCLLQSFLENQVVYLKNKLHVYMKFGGSVPYYEMAVIQTHLILVHTSSSYSLKISLITILLYVCGFSGRSLFQVFWSKFFIRSLYSACFVHNAHNVMIMIVLKCTNWMFSVLFVASVTIFAQISDDKIFLIIV